MCKWGCELCAGQAQLKAQLTACWARLQGYGGAKAAQLNVGTEPEATALALLELLACGILDTGPAADKATALGKARELLTTSGGAPKPEPELWVRVAQQARALGDLAGSIVSMWIVEVLGANPHQLRDLRGLLLGTSGQPIFVAMLPMSLALMLRFLSHCCACTFFSR